MLRDSFFFYFYCLVSCGANQLCVSLSFLSLCAVVYHSSTCVLPLIRASSFTCPFVAFFIVPYQFSSRLLLSLFFFFPFLFFPFRFVVNAMGKCKFLPWLPFHLPTCSTLCSGILHSLKILSHNPTPSSPLVAFIKLINN